MPVPRYSGGQRRGRGGLSGSVGCVRLRPRLVFVLRGEADTRVRGRVGEGGC